MTTPAINTLRDLLGELQQERAKVAIEIEAVDTALQLLLQEEPADHRD